MSDRVESADGAFPATHPGFLAPTAGRLIVVDLQTGLLPHITESATVEARATLLIRGATALGVQVAATEQAPEKLGETVVPVAEELNTAKAERVPKTVFGAAGPLGLTDAVSDRRFQAVLCGIETHVCIAQTALELMSGEYAVTIAADACGSRRASDHEIALARLTAEGAKVSSVEAILFEWCGSAEHPAFRTLRDLVKEA
ncbi:MAG: isochorismatase family protein [Planctomycetota bacterium]